MDFISSDTVNLVHVAFVAPLLWYHDYVDDNLMKGLAVFVGGYHLYRWYWKVNRGPMVIGRPLGRQ